tara:strand:+ start:10270 stop:11151 length:882 start_codon:yes stop_codon:yes gene_type:complete
MKKLLFVLVLISTATGCKTTGLSPNNGGVSSTVIETIREQREQTKEITDAGEAITEGLVSIDEHAENILNEVALAPNQSDPILTRIEHSAEAIKEDVDLAEKEQIRIEEALEDLNAANSRVSAAIGHIENLEELVLEYEQSDREVRKEALQNLHSFITLFFVIGFSMLVGGTFLAFWVGGKLGGVVLAIGILTVGFASASQFYLEEIATVGLVVLVVGIVAALGVVGWMLIDGRHDKEAMKEIIQLVEEMKVRLSPEERKEVFGVGGYASKVTSSLTKNIISQIKIKNGFKKI